MVEKRSCFRRSSSGTRNDVFTARRIGEIVSTACPALKLSKFLLPGVGSPSLMSQSPAAQIDASDRRREQQRPYRRQRDPARWGEARVYGWSEDKARQYAEPLRADFGAFVRAKGFRLE